MNGQGDEAGGGQMIPYFREREIDVNFNIAGDGCEA